MDDLPQGTYHSFRLPDGREIRGQADTFERLKALHLPGDLSGLDVLDIGSHEGFYSFECERRGAESVVAADKITWEMFPEHRATFDTMRDLFESDVEVVESSVEELVESLKGRQFDLTLFLGVLYHAPDPFEYLRIVKQVSKGLVVIETVVDFLDIDLPVLAYYPGDTYNGDTTNVTAPNIAALHAMMEDVGFRDIEIFDPHERHRIHQLHANEAVYPRSLLSKLRSRLLKPTVSGRVVVHARAD
ncbi:MAG: DUF1698 domain-containing protein [Acidimicrobiia bacterium]|nr:DUF1698 domain-containing protein [Acidimicrobiia bacterium]